MKVIAIAAAVLTLAACATLRTLAPQTTAGYEANGILGALDGATGAILARCRTLDGREIRIAFDDLAYATGVDIEQVRAERQRACAVVGAVALVGSGFAVSPELGVTVHGTAEGISSDE